MVAALSEALGSKSVEFSPIDRLGLLDDAFALVKNGSLDIAILMGLLKNYNGETQVAVVSTLTRVIGSICSIHSSHDFFPTIKKYVGSVFRDVYNQYGWVAKENEDASAALLRPQFISMMGLSGDEDVIAEAKKRVLAFSKNMKDASILPADIRGVAYSIAIKNGGEEEWNAVKSICDITDLTEEKYRTMSTLGLTPVEALQKKTMEWAFSEVRSGDVPYPISGICRNKNGRELVWNYLTTNWEAFNGKFKGAGFLIPNVINSAVSGFSDRARADEVSKFFEANPCKPAERTVKYVSRVVL